jgi:hypothetical protein
MVQPLRLPHRLTLRDMLVQSYAYDRRGRRSEVFYRWKSAVQYGPISAAMFEEIATAISINSVLDKSIKSVASPGLRSELSGRRSLHGVRVSAGR